MPGPSVRAGAASLGVALLLLAACSGGGKSDDESVAVIPFAADPVGDPGTGAEMAPDDVPDCTPDDLVLRLLTPDQVFHTAVQMLRRYRMPPSVAS